MIEMRDLKRQYNAYKREISNSISRVLSHAQFISGPEVEELEKKLANYVGVDYCISCANGTDAMSLVLMAWNIGPGDAVFVPDLTFVATAEVVSLRGATPIFVDVDPRTFNIDVNDLENAILEVFENNCLTPKLIIPVDLFGLPADYPKIEKVAKKYNLRILEDAAQGFGGSITNRKACSFGDVATTSFFPAKPLGCYGDGGAIFTNNKELAEILMSLRVHGKGQDKYDNVRVGTNSRLDSLQASILLEKLKILDKELKKVNDIAKEYNSQLSDKVIKPLLSDGFESSFAQYTLIFKSNTQRDKIKQMLLNLGIPTVVFYPKSLSSQSVFRDNYHLRKPLISNKLSERVLSIPIHPYLTKRELAFIISSINQLLT
jgi:UDP-2-acetamido-2-deoxy-ribo-hexuluronate aminotransferase